MSQGALYDANHGCWKLGPRAQMSTTWSSRSKASSARRSRSTRSNRSTAAAAVSFTGQSFGRATRSTTSTSTRRRLSRASGTRLRTSTTTWTGGRAGVAAVACRPRTSSYLGTTRPHFTLGSSRSEPWRSSWTGSTSCAGTGRPVLVRRVQTVAIGVSGRADDARQAQRGRGQQEAAAVVSRSQAASSCRYQSSPRGTPSLNRQRWWMGRNEWRLGSRSLPSRPSTA